ncbi:alkyl hydroperoxide reductase/ Thiol specific antioxidant/ Mal allergen [Pirellula staleyi DSM 6068]|uniref:thioredoxin-dependent peroxiredoxin n=1 Tax=Pirellula staleyi (strain ATCC 27377 / DSM 6068 / ICPB 4128) TaxID=530564 RepID=D2QWH9_PIRSD|nr:redoxin domain-containing protein [Pirellula staleyi]ADB17782.1 alkyl hydroperoxide reductase/ Thiol specific antioxidant/ Mal allergen [Pirellula staleyi DSM 6068]
MSLAISKTQMLAGFAAVTLATVATLWADADSPPAKGDVAKDFTLQTLDGTEVQLSKLNAKGPVVVVVLRGYPGYQCPACNAQTGEFIGAAKKFAAAKANVVLVYPGEGKGLEKFAKDFVTGKTFPDNVMLVTDPDYKFTVAYNLRWDAQNETAFPSTFVIDAEGKIIYSKISETHGGRAPVAEVLKALE